MTTFNEDRKNIEFLVSTMNMKDISLVKELNIKSKCIIVNQTDKESTNMSTNLVKVIYDNNKGLSRSRNIALNHSKADILVLSDDDVYFVDNADKIIIDEYYKNPNFDVIIFYMQKTSEQFNPIFKKKKKIGYLNSLKMFSMGITFKRNSVVNNVKFNECFGAGAKYSMGEENIFLIELLKNKVKILYVPIKIGELKDSDSTWFRGFNEKYFFDKGAIFYCISKFFWLILSVQFLIRKRKLYKNNFSILSAFKYMKKGKEEYKKELFEKNV